MHRGTEKQLRRRECIHYHQIQAQAGDHPVEGKKLKLKESVADIIASKQSGNPVKIGKLTLLVKQGALE